MIRTFRRRTVASVLVCVLSATCSAIASAHEVRPGYLELTEREGGQFDVLWRVPLYRGAPLFIRPILPASTSPETPIASSAANGAEIKRWRVSIDGSLRGETIQIQNLESTVTDVLVRIQFADGGSETLRLTPDAATTTIPTVPSRFLVAQNYIELGVQHILLGIDHLLFVLSLVLLVTGFLRLVETITAFTIAHSISLAAATLGIVNVPSAPVDAIVALSIVFVAGEIIHKGMGRPSLGERYPWAVAFMFGLLHGLGFAGALTALGLPQHAVPIALLFFNVGVEAGQLIFIIGALLFMLVLDRMRISWPQWSYRIPAYAIGGIAMFWCFQRIAAMVGFA